MTRDRIRAAFNEPMTAEDRVRLVSLDQVGATTAIAVSDLREILSTLDALRVSYAERGDVIAGLMKGER